MPFFHYFTHVRFACVLVSDRHQSVAADSGFLLLHLSLSVSFRNSKMCSSVQAALPCLRKKVEHVDLSALLAQLPLDLLSSLSVPCSSRRKPSLTDVLRLSASGCTGLFLTHSFRRARKLF